MINLKVIKGNNNKEDKREAKRVKMFDIYNRAFQREILNCGSTIPEKPKNINKLITYGVRIVNLASRDNLTQEGIETLFQLIQIVNYFIGQLTPPELINLFPIEKTYYGDRWEMKDYFYTKKFMDSLPQDKPIGPDSVLEILWEYMNMELRIYTVNYTSVMDKIAVLNGEKGAWEQFIEDAGITTYTLRKEGDKEILIDNDTGEVQKIKRKSKYKVLEGGK
jgi:hypothetical protein